MEIEQLARRAPEALAKVPVDALAGVDAAKAREIVDAAGFPADVADQVADVLVKLWAASSSRRTPRWSRSTRWSAPPTARSWRSTAR